MTSEPLPVPPAQPEDPQVAAMTPLCSVFRRYLKSRNLKYTPERADILNIIIEHDGIFEVEDLLIDVRERGHSVSMATIYRTVKLLQDAGIISHALFDSRQSHYQLVYGKTSRDSIVCLKTGRHIEFSDEELAELRNRICRSHGWKPIAHRFQIYALSPEGEKLIAHETDED